MKKHVKLFEEFEELDDVFSGRAKDYITPEPKLIDYDSSKNTITVKLPNGQTSIVDMQEDSDSRELVDDGGGGQYSTTFVGEDDFYYYEIGANTDNYDNVDFEPDTYFEYESIEDKRKSEEASKIAKQKHQAEFEKRQAEEKAQKKKEQLASGLSEEEFKFKKNLESEFERLEDYLKELSEKASTDATTKYLVISDMSYYNYEDRIEEPYISIDVVLGKDKEDAIDRYNKARPDKKSNVRQVIRRYAEELSKYPILVKYSNLLPDFSPIHGDIPGVEFEHQYEINKKNNK